MKILFSVIFFILTPLRVLALAPSAACPVAVGGVASNAIQHSSVLVFIDRDKYKISQSMQIYAGIMNESENTLYIYNSVAWGYGGGFVLHVKDAEGRPVTSDVMDDALLPPPRNADDLGIFVDLDPENFFGIHRAFPVDKIVGRPGKYFITVEYNSPLPCSIMSPRIQNLRALWREDKSLMSKKISFEVIP